MALLLDITLENGVVANYHRISKANFDFNKGIADITLVSYVTDRQRSVEKQSIADVSSMKSMRDRLDYLVQNASDENVEERNTLTNTINSIVESSGEPTAKELAVSTQTFSIAVDASLDISKSSIYDIVKATIDEFGNADSDV